MATIDPVAMKPLRARPFRRSEIPALLNLMRDLARFEGYIAQFAVGADELIAKGLGANPSFRAYVVPDPADDAALLGMAVTYRIPWTYDLRPVLVLKELYIRADQRGLGVGTALMQRVCAEAAEIGATRIEWSVLKSNMRAKDFYRGLGATPDPLWERWVLRAG